MYGVTEVDGILGDLAFLLISLMLQNVVFSTRSDAPLDMRMNVLQHLNARKVVNDSRRRSFGNISTTMAR